MLSVQDALARILKEIHPGQTESVGLSDAYHRILAEQVVSLEDLPPFDNSSMDGFAVHAADTTGASRTTPKCLPVVGDIPAGSNPAHAIQPGQVMRIMTGAPMPDGADAVVQVEETNASYDPGSRLPEEIEIYLQVEPHTNTRPAGMDIRKGEVLMSPGQTLTPSEVGLLASIGMTSVAVYRKPRVAVFATGDELVPPDQPLGPGKIRESNSYVLTGLICQAGGIPVVLSTSPDRPEEIRQRLEQAFSSQVDLIITSAGVSMGVYDYVRQVVEENGSLDFWKVNMRPGKPMAFGQYRGIPLVGLPGNPVSSYVGFLVFVQPIIQKMSGMLEQPRKIIRAILDQPLHSDGRETYLRGIVTHQPDGPHAHLTGHQGSGNLFSLVQANALLIVPSGVKSLAERSEVNAWLLD